MRKANIKKPPRFWKSVKKTMNEDYLCGLSFWRPNWLQNCANIRWFMAIYGLLGTVQGVSYAYLVVTLTTLEKRFHMPSQTTGIVLSGNEISQILLSLILSYFGGQKNRPLWIAWGMLFCGFSCLILAAPHFIYGMGEEAFHLTKEYFDNTGGDWNDVFSNSTTANMGPRKTNSLCRIGELNDTKCNNLVIILPLVLIFLSQFVLGIGNTLYYSLGQTYLDDNSKKRNTPMLFAYAMVMRMVGPTIGFTIGPQALSIFIDPSKTPLVTRNDPRWLGAWWLGWIIIGAIMFVFSILLALFPRKLSSQNQYTVNSTLTVTPPTTELYPLTLPGITEKKLVKSQKKEENEISFHDFCGALNRVLRNKIVIFNNISGIFYILGASGYFIYLGRYIEVQFYRTSQSATALAGQVTMLGTVLGLLVSGRILSKNRPASTKVLFWNVIIGCIYMLGQISYLFLYCKSDDSAVIKVWTNLTTSCNQNCNCGQVSYNPVCHQEANQLFFSPCHAGCKTWDAANNTYSDCSCIHNRIQQYFLTSIHTDNIISPSPPSTNSSSMSRTISNILTGGLCSKKNCVYDLYAFSGLALIIALMNSTGKIGNILVNYRAVADRDKAFTQGLTLTMLSLFAFIPGPIIFGRIMDSACLVWKYKCGVRGECQLYDQDSFRYYMNTLALIFTMFGTIFDGLVWYFGRKLDLYGDTD